MRPSTEASPSGPTQHMAMAAPVQTPQLKTTSLPQMSPLQTSPQRSTPGSAGGKTTVLKALPTVRDHTTDQLGPGGDEYIPREIDEAGETKVSADGYPLDGRKYKCRTFQVPKRGDKLFMLATECARVLGYRDSYLLFNKNRSLHKIIANQPEKDNLIHQEILPYSYRSRQIAIVTARSMFRQFGSRLVEGGRRVRDDYWEAKARKQGFTEEDAAGEKRPGAAKAREAAAAEASNHSNALTSLPQGEIIYSNATGLEGQPQVPPGLHPVTLAPLPMIHLPSDDLRPRDYGNIIRPRQEVAGPAYQDRTVSSSPQDILSQASQAAEYNKILSTQRQHRSNYLDDYWRRPHEAAAPPAHQDTADTGTVAPQHLHSPQAVSHAARVGQPDMMSQQNQGQMVPPSGYPVYPNQQNAMNQSPAQVMHRSLPASQMHQPSPSMGMSAAQQHRQTPSFSYGQNQMWPPPQPSPLSQSHHMPQYGQQSQQQHHSPMPPPPQLPHQNSGGIGMNFPQMNQMGNSAYSAMNRSMYQPNASPQQFNIGTQSNAGPQPGMQGWSAPGSAGSMSQDWQQRYQ